MKETLKIGIIGAGKLGRVLATMLAHHGYDVELAARTVKSGIKIENMYCFDIIGDWGECSHLVPVVKSIDKFATKKDIIIIATKVYDTVKLLDQVMKYLTKTGTVVTFQNSYCIDALLRKLPGMVSVCAYSDFACVEEGQSTRVIDSNGMTIGVYDKGAYTRMKRIEKIFSTFCTVHTNGNIVGYVVGRNIINFAISGLGAISGMRLGDIMNDRNGRFLFCKLVDEGVRVFKKYRVKILPYNNQLDYDLFTQNGWKASRYRRKIMNLLGKNNRYVKSSALHSLESGKKTELAYIMDNFMAFADKFGIYAEYTRGVSDMLKDIESGIRRINNDAFYDERLLSIGRKDYDYRRYQKS